MLCERSRHQYRKLIDIVQGVLDTHSLLPRTADDRSD